VLSLETSNVVRWRAWSFVDQAYVGDTRDYDYPDSQKDVSPGGWNAQDNKAIADEDQDKHADHRTDHTPASVGGRWLPEVTAPRTSIVTLSDARGSPTQLTAACVTPARPARAPANPYNETGMTDGESDAAHGFGIAANGKQTSARHRSGEKEVHQDSDDNVGNEDRRQSDFRSVRV
jgi:hypothetical protein